MALGPRGDPPNIQLLVGKVPYQHFTSSSSIPKKARSDYTILSQVLALRLWLHTVPPHRPMMPVGWIVNSKCMYVASECGEQGMVRV